MIALQPVILFGFLLVPFTQGEEKWMLDIKQSRKRSSESQVPGKPLWALSTSSGLSCAALCLRKTGCLLYGYQNYICHGYVGSEARIPLVGMPVIFQGHFMRYFKHKGIKEQAMKHPKSKNDGYRYLTSGSTHLLVKRYDNDRSRDEALEVCQTEGATLVKLDSWKKVRLFVKEFRNRQEAEQMFLIGLSDRYDNDTWYWTDGTRLGRYSNWDFDEPDHTGDGMKENCAGISLGGFSVGDGLIYRVITHGVLFVRGFESRAPFHEAFVKLRGRK